MAAILLRLHVEHELYSDVVRDLVGVMAALVYRHGEPFRILERQIEALLDDLPDADVHDLGLDGDCLFIAAAPPPALLAPVREARRLRVVPIFQR